MGGRGRGRRVDYPRTAERFRQDARFELEASAAEGAILDEAQGRAAVIELDPLTAQEAGQGPHAVGWEQVWLKGGFADALRGDSRAWWEAYLRLLLERDLPQYGVRADPLFMRRLLTMLAHQHGGLLHHLLNISTADELASHPSRGANWEGFVIEDLLRRERLQHPATQAYFWRTAVGAEIDLVLDRGSERIAVEIKAGRGDDARAVRTLREAMPDVPASRAWIVDQAAGVELIGERIARTGFAQVLQGTP